jgi:hypothetical protein
MLHVLPPILPPILSSRSLSSDDENNIVFGILALVIGIVSIILAWAMWKV